MSNTTGAVAGDASAQSHMLTQSPSVPDEAKQPVYTGSDFASGDQTIFSTAKWTARDPSISALEDGGYVIAWLDDATWRRTDISYRLADEFGNPVSGRRTANDVVGNNPYEENRHVTTTALDDGGFVIGWGVSHATEKLLHPGLSTVVYASDGTIVEEMFGYQSSGVYQTLVPLNDGTYYSVTSGARLGTYHFDAEGQEISYRWLSEIPLEYGYEPAGVQASSGDVAIVYEHQNGIQFRVYDEALNARIDAVDVNQTEGWAEFASVIELSGGCFVVAWNYLGAFGSTLEDRERFSTFRIVNADGTFVTDEVRFPLGPWDNQQSVEIVATSDGGFVVIWGGEDYSVKLQQFDATGAAIAEPVQVVDENNSGNGFSAELLADGTLVVTYVVLGDVAVREFNLKSSFDVTAGDDLIAGGWADDYVVGQSGDDTLGGGRGDDSVLGGTGDDEIAGHSGDDTLSGDSGEDTISGGSGDDLVLGSSGDDDIQGGAGRDTLKGGVGDDTVGGGADDDRILAGGGNDQVSGGSGDDLIAGGVGHDILVGGSTDYLSHFADDPKGDGADTLYGSDGDDTVVGGTWQDNGDGAVSLNELNLKTEAGDNIIWGGTGDDDLYGADGADLMRGGRGHDLIYGFDGADALFGGAGPAAESDDTLDGGAGWDRIYGGAGDDSIVGGSGYDLIFGGNDNDIIRAGLGDDTVWGGAGDDYVAGGSGDDDLSGGAGSDRIVFAAGHGQDTVTDFSVEEDTLELGGVTAGFATAADVQAAATETTVDDNTGMLIDTGGGDSIFLVGVTPEQLATIDYTF